MDLQILEYRDDLEQCKTLTAIKGVGTASCCNVVVINEGMHCYSHPSYPRKVLPRQGHSQAICFLALPENSRPY